MKKKIPEEMEVVRQRRFQNDVLGMSNSIPRSTEFDLHPEKRGWCGRSEFSYVQDKPGKDPWDEPVENPGNALWSEKDRP
jgi:hypothetical protein